MGAMVLAIVPEAGLLLLAAITLGLDLIWRDRRCRKLGWFTAAGMLVIGVVSLVFSRPPAEGLLVWGGMLRFDATGFVFRMIFLAAAGITALLSLEDDDLCVHGEFYTMLVASTLGMSLMASAADLIMVFLAIEMTTIPLFVMVGFITRDERSVESGIKYLLFGAMTSAVMLYGFSLLYGFTGTTSLYELGQMLQAGQVPLAAVIAAMMLVLAGFGFKISAVPFHFWAPDVYQGAPTPVAGYLSTASKAAGFVVLLRVFLVAFPDMTAAWTMLVAILAVASMLLGNFLALAQRSVKRLLAYSSIAQAGYILVGVAAGTQFGASAAAYYLMAYMFTNLAAFGVVMVVSRSMGSDDLPSFSGLGQRSPALALLMLAALLSLAGIPPFAGFIGKVLVFAAAIQAGMIWLAVVGVLNSLLALYYYLVVLKWIYRPVEAGQEGPLFMAPSWRVALIACGIGILVLGVVVAPWLQWSTLAAVFF